MTTPTTPGYHLTREAEHSKRQPTPTTPGSSPAHNDDKFGYDGREIAVVLQDEFAAWTTPPDARGQAATTTDTTPMQRRGDTGMATDETFRPGNGQRARREGLARPQSPPPPPTAETLRP